jgi:hypothetical protein
LDCPAEYEIIKQFGVIGLQTFAVRFEFGPHFPALVLAFISADFGDAEFCNQVKNDSLVM